MQKGPYSTYQECLVSPNPTKSEPYSWVGDLPDLLLGTQGVCQGNADALRESGLLLATDQTSGGWVRPKLSSLGSGSSL